MIPLETRVGAMSSALLDDGHPLHEICWGYLLNILDIPFPIVKTTADDPMPPVKTIAEDPMGWAYIVKGSLRRILAEADRNESFRLSLRIPYDRLMEYHRKLSSRLDLVASRSDFF